MGAAISAWGADECPRVLGQELDESGAARADLVRGAREAGADPRNSFKVSRPLITEYVGETAVDALSVLVWEIVDGVKTVEASALAEDLQDPTWGMASWTPRDV